MDLLQALGAGLTGYMKGRQLKEQRDTRIAAANAKKKTAEQMELDQRLINARIGAYQATGRKPYEDSVREAFRDLVKQERDARAALDLSKAANVGVARGKIEDYKTLSRNLREKARALFEANQDILAPSGLTFDTMFGPEIPDANLTPDRFGWSPQLTPYSAEITKALDMLREETDPVKRESLGIPTLRGIRQRISQEQGVDEETLRSVYPLLFSYEPRRMEIDVPVVGEYQPIPEGMTFRSPDIGLPQTDIDGFRYRRTSVPFVRDNAIDRSVVFDPSTGSYIRRPINGVGGNIRVPVNQFTPIEEIGMQGAAASVPNIGIPTPAIQFPTAQQLMAGQLPRVTPFSEVVGNIPRALDRAGDFSRTATGLLSMFGNADVQAASGVQSLAELNTVEGRQKAFNYLATNPETRRIMAGPVGEAIQDFMRTQPLERAPITQQKETIEVVPGLMPSSEAVERAQKAADEKANAEIKRKMDSLNLQVKKATFGADISKAKWNAVYARLKAIYLPKDYDLRKKVANSLESFRQASLKMDQAEFNQRVKTEIPRIFVTAAANAGRMVSSLDMSISQVGRQLMELGKLSEEQWTQYDAAIRPWVLGTDRSQASKARYEAARRTFGKDAFTVQALSNYETLLKQKQAAYIDFRELSGVQKTLLDSFGIQSSGVVMPGEINEEYEEDIDLTGFPDPSDVLGGNSPSPNRSSSRNAGAGKPGGPPPGNLGAR